MTKHVSQTSDLSIAQSSEQVTKLEGIGLEAVTWRLPFAFAKRYSVLFSKDKAGFTLHCLADISLETIVEVRRVIKAPFNF